MKSLKRFKNRIVQDNNISHRATERLSETEQKISQIRSSSYKLETKYTNRSATKTDHSIQKKSPIRIPDKFLKKDKITSNRKGQRKFLYDQEDIFRNVKSIPVSETKTSFEASFHIRKTPKDHKQQFQAFKENQPLSLNQQEVQCMRDLWRSVHKLEGNKRIAHHINDLKSILNKICERGLKTEFQFQEEKQTRKAIRAPSVSSNVMKESLSIQKEYPAELQQPIESSPQPQSYTITSSDLFSSNLTHQNNIQYRKIVYMLDRNSQSNISQTKEKYFDSIQQQPNDRVVEVISRISSISSEETHKHNSYIDQSSISNNNKRVVLQQIVNMLNTKYHKNIKMK